MKALFKSILPLFVVVILFNACDKQKEAVPSYLHISKFTFTSNPNSQGLGTTDIIGAKVFVNGSEIGNFEIPVTIPVLATGTCRIEVFPNIKENGIGSSQKYYKPYTSFLDTIVMAAGKIDTIYPYSTYRSSCVFDWIEDFEDQAVSLVESGLDNTPDSILIIPTSTPGVDMPFKGSNYCGLIEIKEDTSVIFERRTLNFYPEPVFGASVYVELDVKSNIDVQVGIYADDQVNIVQSPVMVIYNTQGNWKKIYVNLLPETGSLSNKTKISVFLGTYKDAGDTEDKYIYFDNLKLIHLQ